MRTLLLGMMIALSVAAGFVMAEESVLARAVKNCEQDITTYCGHVKPGEGRIMACLYANDHKITSQCGMALNEVALWMENVKKQVTDFMDACETDRENYCPTAEWGHGGVAKCLFQQSYVTESVSTSCRLALKRIGLN